MAACSPIHNETFRPVVLIQFVLANFKSGRLINKASFGGKPVDGCLCILLGSIDTEE